MTESIRIGLVTVSDRAFHGEYEDRGGPAMESWLNKVLTNSDVEYEKIIVADEIDEVVSALDRLHRAGCCLILTTGGTGPAPRDITPEATEKFCDRVLDGFGEEMRRASLNVVPTAILSRQIAGTKGSTLVINLPGKPSAIDDCLTAVFAAVPYCIDLIGGPRLETDPGIIKAFRPQKRGNK